MIKKRLSEYIGMNYLIARPTESIKNKSCSIYLGYQIPLGIQSCIQTMFTKNIIIQQKLFESMDFSHN